ncbi:methyl jasmonate esterase 1-like [Malania oleifera]|uniref:methyl jasmonate esterase 1-like n=1 Tax=Malania oleifera TaxID=397392 RepID=UPI0025AE8DB2|nr:methyl jasmonate esterase 1-like [Malania oleifera]
MDNQFGFDDDPHNPPTSILFGPDFLSSKLYHLSPPEDLTLAKMLVRPERLYGAEVAEEMALTEEKYGSVRRVFVVCEEDKVLKEDFQRWMIQKNPPEEVEDISGSDHMVMLSNPAHLCSSLLGIAERFY